MFGIMDPIRGTRGKSESSHVLNWNKHISKFRVKKKWEYIIHMLILYHALCCMIQTSYYGLVCLNVTELRPEWLETTVQKRDVDRNGPGNYRLSNRANTTSEYLAESHDYDEPQSQKLASGEDILDTRGPADTVAVHPWQQHWGRRDKIITLVNPLQKSQGQR